MPDIFLTVYILTRTVDMRYNEHIFFLEADTLVSVLVNGACGRMGQAVLKAVQEDSELKLVGAVDLQGGMDAGELVGLPACGVTVETDLAAALTRCKPEVMVDFTRPDVVFSNVKQALSAHVSPVVGTTGLSEEQKAEIAALAEKEATPAFIAPNFAIGAVLMMVMCKQAAKYMPDVEIIELHHDKKLDAPSGTAVIFFTQARVVWPSRIIVQAPHCPLPQPTSMIRCASPASCATKAANCDGADSFRTAREA